MPLGNDLRQPAMVGAAAMALAAAFLIYAGVAVVRGMHDPSLGAGLSYRDLASELGEALREVPADSLLRADTTSVVLAGTATGFDTLVVVGDTTRFPSFREGGFLRDQVMLYNAFQRWRAEVGTHRAAWFDSLAPFNPSVFRTERRKGVTGLSRAATVYAMRLPSPFEDAWRVRVLTREPIASPGLVSRSARVLLRQDVAVPIEIDGRRHECRIERRGRVARFFCKSLLQTPQLTMRLDSALPPSGMARAGWAAFQYDGAAVRRGDSAAVVSGGLLTIKGLQPSVFTQYEPGLIASTQWVNGRARRVRSGPGVLQFLAQLGNRPATGATAAGRELSIRLSVDGALSAELTDSLAAAVAGLPIDFASVVLADAVTGEILGIGEVGARANPDRSNLMRPLNVGSAIKPILAAAILSERPELAALEVAATDGAVESVFGLPMGGFHSALNCGMPPGGWVNLSYFIRCSNNHYAAALVLASLSEMTSGGYMVLAPGATAPYRLGGTVYSERRPRIPRDRGGRVPRDWVVSAPIATGLLRVFDVAADPTVSDEVGRSSTLWRDLEYSSGAPVSVPWELLPEESRPALVERKASGSPPALLAAYGYGGWENQWTLLDLTQSFARILTDRRLSLTFAPRTRAEREENDERAAPLDLARQRWYGTLVEALASVGETGTARGLNPAWRTLVGANGAIYSKTGTLAEAGDSLFVRTMVFGLGRDYASTRAALDCGIVGTVYFKFRRRPVEGMELGAYHTSFATERLTPILKRHWERLGACRQTERMERRGRPAVRTAARTGD